MKFEGMNHDRGREVPIEFYERAFRKMPLEQRDVPCEQGGPAPLIEIKLGMHAGIDNRAAFLNRAVAAN